MLENNFIKCRAGEEREIFPALIKHKNRIRHFALKFKSDMAIMNILAPDLNFKGEKMEDAFLDEPYNAMMEILVMAFGEKYTKKEIESFVDVEMIPEILDVFFGISGYKKKLMENQKNPLLGMSSVPA